MTKIRNDFKVQPNTQHNRTQENLWDIVVGGARFITTSSKEKADGLATLLNKDPHHMYRGQTRAEMYGAEKSIDRKEQCQVAAPMLWMAANRERL